MVTATGAAQGDRYLSIDAVRGFAVLGILLMNIVGMGLPSFAYIDPTYAGMHGPADLWTWAVNNVLTDGKMRALFTMLFGASAVLIAQRAEGGSPGPAQTHYRRMFWLFVSCLPFRKLKPHPILLSEPPESHPVTLPGLPPTVGYIPLSRYTIPQIADMLIRKLEGK